MIESKFCYFVIFTESLQQILQSDSSFSATSTCTVVMTPNALNSNDLTELLQPMSCEIAMITEMPDDVVMSSDTATNDSHNSYANMLPNQENIQQAPPLFITSSSSNNGTMLNYKITIGFIFQNLFTVIGLF